MGCNCATGKSTARKPLRGISSLAKTELDKWNSRQVQLARSHFLKGVQRPAETLSYQAFELVFPSIRILPEVVSV